MTEFATDSREINRKKSRARQDREINDLIIRQIMSQQPGRRWIWNILRDSHLFEQSVYFGEDSLEKTYFAAGERNFGLRLLADVTRLCPAEYILAMQEANKMETTNGRDRDDPISGEPGTDDAEQLDG